MSLNIILRVKKTLWQLKEAAKKSDVELQALRAANAA
jgi:hypothetical protein